MAAPSTTEQVAPSSAGQSGYWKYSPTGATFVTSAPAPATPVSMLSTDSAQSTLNSNLTKLNTLSPTTAPGYVAPTPTTPTTNTTTPAAPKAYFRNDNGQEAEYTQDQLNDPVTQNFLESGGYVQTNTEGPSYDNPLANASSDVKTLDQQIQDLNTQFSAFNVDDDPVFKSMVSGITDQFDTLRDATLKANDAQAASFNTLGLRNGTTQYAGGVQLGINSEVLTQATKRISDLNQKESDTIASARSAYQTGKFAEFTSHLDALEKIRSDKYTELTDLQKTVAAATKTLQDTTIRASRDSAIGSLVAQGVTDPSQILEYLNVNDKGQQVGDFTSAEIATALKNLAPEGDIDKLSGVTRDFYILQKQGKLPSSVSSLPEDQQLFGYLSQEKRASTINNGSSGTKITLSDIKASGGTTGGLPISLLGKSQQDVVDSLQTINPPDWFVEKLNTETNSETEPSNPNTMALWDKYRQNVLGNMVDGTPKTDPNYTKASDYFSSTYDSLDSDQIDQLASQVKTYVDGGMTYAKAVQQTEDDINQ